DIRIKITRHNDIDKSIIRSAEDYDLVVLHSTRYRTAGGLAVGDITTKISSQLQTSMILFNEL
ncbi:MAG: hypothetical protein WBB82_10225, partial [Limnothrix sp.]